MQWSDKQIEMTYSFIQQTIAFVGLIILAVIYDGEFLTICYYIIPAWLGYSAHAMKYTPKHQTEIKKPDITIIRPPGV